MTAINWDEMTARIFEAGVDRGVLYDPFGSGVAWNGISAVEEENNNEVEAVYFDGLKFNDIVTIGEFSGTLRAYTYPDEFLKFDGVLEDQAGVLVTDQPQRRFHLSYRTMIGDPISGIGVGYKIHVLYNLTANAQTKNYETLGLEVDPMELEWELTSIPEEIDGYRPTAHLILDSRKIDPWLLIDLEAILYGDATSDPRLPSMKALMTFIRKWDRLIVVDHGDGTWSAISQDDNVISIDPDGYFELTIDDSNVEYPDADSYTISSSDKNDGDITP